MSKGFLGIDVGYSERKLTTGLCLLSVDDSFIRWHCFNTGTQRERRLEDLRLLISPGTKLLSVAIDGPLAAGLTRVAHYRSAEALLSRGQFLSRCKPGQTNVLVGQRLHHHASELAELVLGLHAEGYLSVAPSRHLEPVTEECIVEAFPNAFLAFLLSDGDFPSVRPPRRKVSDYFWGIAVKEGYLPRLVDSLAPGKAIDQPLESVTDHDHRAALICALTAFCVWRNRYVAVGDPIYGDFILPPSDHWDAGMLQPWPEMALRTNVRLVGRNRVGNADHANARIIRNGTHWF